MKAALSPSDYLNNYPMKTTGNFTKKVIIKDDYVKEDGTAALYVQVFLNRERKRFPLKINVAPKHFDKIKQRVRGANPNSKDLNLLIDNQLSVFTNILTEYRLRKIELTMDLLCKEITDPDSKICFLKFYEATIEEHLKSKAIQQSTYRQQKSTLTKLRKFRNPIFFNEIDKNFLEELLTYLRVKKKNTPNTIATTLKNFKKYLHLANDLKIQTPLHYTEIKVRAVRGNRTFLEEEEIRRIHKYYKSEFIKELHYKVLKKFLFSCFTGLRISDIQKLTQDNFIGDFLVFTSEKTGKLQRLKMSASALSFINKEGNVFEDDFQDQTINYALKDIAKLCKIQKHVTFHVSRHTFATQFLIKGGEIRVLQKILGHSKIETTMIYVHVAEEHVNTQIQNLDSLIEL